VQGNIAALDTESGREPKNHRKVVQIHHGLGSLPSGPGLACLSGAEPDASWGSQVRLDVKERSGEARPGRLGELEACDWARS